MTFLLGVSDMICLTVAVALAVAIRTTFDGALISLPLYLQALPLLLLFLGSYAWNGLYPGVGTNPVEELRRISTSTSAVFLLVTAASFWVRAGASYSRLVIAISWLLALALVPSGRWIARLLAIRAGLWGEPVAVIGYGPESRKIVLYFLKKLHLGLRPVLVIDGANQPENDTQLIPGLRYQSYDLTPLSDKNNPIQTAVLVSSEIPAAWQTSIIDQNRFGFKRLIVIPNLQLTGSVGVISHDLEGMLGLEVRQNLLHPAHRFLKRCMDIVLVVLAAIPAVLVAALIAVLIRLDSPGKALFGQERIGRDGRHFITWKFRTMVEDAELILEDWLKRDPLLLDEWETTQKLKKDPRLTRVGRILRRLSLDELPQLYNILVGEMSLVGPRPILPEQQAAYGKTYNLYVKVRPGLTGMWQVSGRNSTTFEERAQWDDYYVRNWSIWLDIYILLRTIWVVIKRDGAY